MVDERSGHDDHRSGAPPGNASDELTRAASAVREQQASLMTLVDEVRRQQSDYANRLVQVERALREVGERRVGAPAATGRSHTEHTLEQAALDEQEHTLRRQQASLAERLSRLQADLRKLRAVVKQSQMSADYLAGTIGDHDDDLVSLTQVWALEAQEQERRRLAREIHDGPAQILANAIFALEYCHRLVVKDPKKLPGELQRLKNDLREGLAEVRHFIFDLRPGPLADLGLVATVQRYAESYQARFPIEVELDLDHNLGRLPANREAAIFRIIQEALQNVRKHANATVVKIRLAATPEGMLVVVEDDGQGFEAANHAEGSLRKFGLTSMQERARLIRAEFRVTSTPGAGTRVEVRVPPEPIAAGA